MELIGTEKVKHFECKDFFELKRPAIEAAKYALRGFPKVTLSDFFENGKFVFIYSINDCVLGLKKIRIEVNYSGIAGVKMIYDDFAIFSDKNYETEYAQFFRFLGNFLKSGKGTKLRVISEACCMLENTPVVRIVAYGELKGKRFIDVAFTRPTKVTKDNLQWNCEAWSVYRVYTNYKISGGALGMVNWFNQNYS